MLTILTTIHFVIIYFILYVVIFTMSTIPTDFIYFILLMVTFIISAIYSITNYFIHSMVGFIILTSYSVIILNYHYVFKLFNLLIFVTLDLDFNMPNYIFLNRFLIIKSYYIYQLSINEYN